MKRAFILVVAVVAACSSSSGHRCPEGYIWASGACRKTHDVVIPPDPGTVKDAQGLDTTRDVADSQKEVVDVTSDGAGENETLDMQGQKSPIGGSCQRDMDCEGADPDDEDAPACLSWNGGYCARPNCLKTPCKDDGSVCVAINDMAAWCVKACKSDDDCRTKDGYACKSITDPWGKLVSACVPAGDRKLGDVCDDFSQCEGGLDCVRSFMGGYCTVHNCDKDNPCPEGSQCVKTQDGNLCLKECKADSDCKVTGDKDVRSCVRMKSAVEFGKRVKVCGTKRLDKGVGQPCSKDYECKEGECMLMYQGLCKESLAPCNTNDDCNGEVCITTKPEYKIGFCTQKCDNGVCPSGGFCVSTVSNGNVCVPDCQAKKCPVHTEPDVKMFECRYGSPRFDQPARYCAPVGFMGDFGKGCKDDSDCPDEWVCITKDGDKGYCAPRCHHGDDACPFPGVCGWFNDVDAGVKEKVCMIQCHEQDDCPDGTECLSGVATTDVCSVVVNNE